MLQNNQKKKDEEKLGETLNEEKYRQLIANMFGSNKQHRNPFHLFFQNQTLIRHDNAYQLIVDMATCIGDDTSFTTKILQQDDLGNTPIHYAVKASLHQIVEFF